MAARRVADILRDQLHHSATLLVESNDKVRELEAEKAETISKLGQWLEETNENFGTVFVLGKMPPLRLGPDVDKMACRQEISGGPRTARDQRARSNRRIGHRRQERGRAVNCEERAGLVSHPVMTSTAH